ncbi:alpha/beta fold hydrolase [Hansschlegelia plantiphila]|uniref:Haloacetate dehalogenase n=1 Tax=Hansschlegelia plantiphila TaxID=374655 RepID=A0A9W6J1S0_9HYPH|nr:alpha/beta hydrolase [Hansschlegelia plantiphila]GLK67694.1 haloacetate dehalogenase [Hansschlegelia plantiphila]
MTEALPDLFPGFESRLIKVGEVEIFARIGGEGPPLLLLHGYPQTHVCWHKIAPALSRSFTLILADLRGYGASSAPAPVANGANYAKREMAEDMVGLMRALGQKRFAVAGHDRGGRVAYRMALDHPERVARLAVLDIVPTARMWSGMDSRMAMKAYHWLFLAQPAPLPETLIGRDPDFFIDWTLASWTASNNLEPFDQRALAHYRAFFRQSARIAATCGDYRAGATVDASHDAVDHEAGRRITAPLLALWGAKGFPSEGSGPLEIWRTWGTDVQGRGLPGGHFLPEEVEQETADALLAFFSAGER